MNVTTALRKAFAPTGELRIAINYGNPILAKRSEEGDQPIGVSVDIARELGLTLNVSVRFVTVDTAGLSVQSVENGDADVGFFAIDPVRAAQISFTSPYVIIEGCYLVQSGSSLKSIDDIDIANNRIVVGKGSAYDLFLTRAIKHAEIIHAASSPAVVETFVQQHLEVAAGVKQQLESDLARHEGLRLIDQPFMQIHQAMGVLTARGEHASRWLNTFIQRLKAEGFIAQALQQHGITGVTIAPV